MSTEVDSARHQVAKLPSNRSFGFVFAGFFMIVAAFPLLKGDFPRWWALCLSAAFLFTAFVFPAVLTVPNKIWSKFGELLHQIISPIILGIMFFLLFTPMGSVMRMFGWDPMKKRFDKSEKSYWVRRDPPGPTPESMKDQF